MNYFQQISITLRQRSKTVVHIGCTHLKHDLKWTELSLTFKYVNIIEACSEFSKIYGKHVYLYELTCSDLTNYITQPPTRKDDIYSVRDRGGCQ